jgi:hypothetical protein
MNQTNRNEPTITGVFHDADQAEHAYDVLMGRGYTRDDVNVIMSDETRKKHYNRAEPGSIGTKAMEGAGAGSAIGGAVGAVAAAIAAIGTSLVIPGLGIVVAGPLAAALAGAGAGGITGGLVGALIGSGIPEDKAKEYETAVKQGKIILTVHPRTETDAEYIEDAWRNYHAEIINR